MSGINGISGYSNLRPAVRPQATEQGGPDFAQMLSQAVSKVEGDQAQATSAIADLVSGQAPDVLGAVQAMAKADMSFKLLMNVRNKVIEAYKQTMQMQV